MSAKVRQLWLVLALLALPCVAHAQRMQADMILLHGRVYTVGAKHSWAQAIAIRDGKIVAVGSDKEMARYRGPATKVLDAKGHLVLPGITDCHVHFLDGSFSLQRINLEDTKNLDEALRRLKEYADAHPKDPWVLGRGWSYPLFPPNGLPDKKFLNAIIPDRPVYIEGFDGHTWWANSKALEAAHITKDTPNPPGGEIVHDPATGEPTGAIKEDAADGLIRRAIPEPSRDEKLRALRAGLKHANELGVTRVHVMGGINPGEGDISEIELLDQLRSSGDLTVRFYVAYRMDPPEVTGAQLTRVEQTREKYHDDWIAGGAVKFFLDGVIETHTAAMLAPYADDPSLSGSLLWDPESYKRFVAELDRRHIQICTHAIGDRAIRLALDAYENSGKVNGTKDARHRIEHIEDASAADIPRFGSLGVIASMQPLHAKPDDDTLNVWAPRVGQERVQRAWAWHSIQSGGGIVAFGSDWPVVTLSPWPGIQNAVTRQTLEGKPAGGWIPSERISLADAIKGYTLNAAYSGHREKDEGSLEAGKLADFIVVSQDLFKIEPSKIGVTQVLLTMVGGQVAYQSEKF
ncbi:MAG: amidohydrolase [Acidobacteria bacterium]|nr:MAG: amidohydrolase [Acidobacteriota bacterium]